MAGRKTLTKEHKQKISQANKGKKRDDATKRKISQAKKGKPRDYATRRKISEGKKRYVFTEEHKQNISNALKNNERYECPHCGKIMPIQHYQRYHGDRCRHNEENSKEINTIEDESIFDWIITEGGKKDG